MRGLLAAAACAAAIAIAPTNGVADDVMDHQVKQIASLTEIKELAVVRMRRAAPEAAEEAAQEAEQMSVDDLLLSGVGERRMMTADDEDDFDAADAAEEPAPAEQGAAASEPAGPAADNGPLVEAIESNRVLARALAERNVDLVQVVSIEVRDGSTVIVYLDETRG